VALRAETTASSYLYAGYLLAHDVKPPVCVWQAGKSFRREKSEGASAAKLRFFEFYQQEFQCVYGVNTKADYSPTLMSS
jgi:glycyl-tRNA synthetase